MSFILQKPVESMGFLVDLSPNGVIQTHKGGISRWSSLGSPSFSQQRTAVCQPSFAHTGQYPVAQFDGIESHLEVMGVYSEADILYALLVVNIKNDRGLIFDNEAISLAAKDVKTGPAIVEYVVKVNNPLNGPLVIGAARNGYSMFCEMDLMFFGLRAGIPDPQDRKKLITHLAKKYDLEEPDEIPDFSDIG